MHDHAPVFASAGQVEPESVHIPVLASVSDVELAVATESCTDAPTAAEPVNVSVRFVVMLSVVTVPVSDALARSGVETTGSAYRRTTIPDPPSPPKLVLAAVLGLPAPPPPPPVLG